MVLFENKYNIRYIKHTSCKKRPKSRYLTTFSKVLANVQIFTQSVSINYSDNFCKKIRSIYVEIEFFLSPRKFLTAKISFFTKIHQKSHNSFSRKANHPVKVAFESWDSLLERGVKFFSIFQLFHRCTLRYMPKICIFFIFFKSLISPVIP